jgi:hypothetical protein
METISNLIIIDEFWRIGEMDPFYGRNKSKFKNNNEKNREVRFLWLRGKAD